MQVQWHQFFDFLFLDLNRKANCLNRNVKSYDNIKEFQNFKNFRKNLYLHIDKIGP